jgi:hypothetical protein
MDCPGPRGFPQPMTNDGYRAQPFWSSLSRVQRIVKNVPAYAGCEPHEIMARLSRKAGARPHHRQRKSRCQMEWPSRCWLRSFTSRGIAQRRVSCPRASRFIVAGNHYREESRQTRIGNRGFQTRVPSARRSCMRGFSARLKPLLTR